VNSTVHPVKFSGSSFNRQTKSCPKFNGEISLRSNDRSFLDKCSYNSMRGVVTHIVYTIDFGWNNIVSDSGATVQFS
jgi:hypothetical protein